MEKTLSRFANMQMLFLPDHSDMIYQVELNISKETDFSYFPNT